MNMIESIKASMARHELGNDEIAQGEAIMRNIFGPQYLIHNLCQILDYGDRDNIPEGAREMQYAQILFAFREFIGKKEFDENLNWNDLIYIRKELIAGKLDAWIYQGH